MDDIFERGCKFAIKHFSWIVGNPEEFREKIKKKVSDEFIDSIKFTGMRVEPHEIILFSYAAGVIALLAAILLDVIIFLFYRFSPFHMGIFTVLLLIFITVGLPVMAIHITSEYPKSRARQMKIHSLGDIPEIISYIVMYLKLIPNLENAIRFAARESNTSLARDLRELIWDMEIRIYKGIDDAMTYFAEEWGKWSDYLKRAIHLIRSSIHEASNEGRNITLDRSLDVVLDGTKYLMTEFANKLHEPTIVIYSIGVMIPLALIAMAPAASLAGMAVSIFQIFLFYDVILPITLFFYMRKILLSRPATFNPPSIPSSHPEIEKINKKANAIFAMFIGILISLPFILSMKTGPIPSSLFPLWGLSAAVSIYSLKTYSTYKKIRDEIKSMEKEFSDSLYVLGKRIMEGKPAEDAFLYASKVMKGSSMAEVFESTAFNLSSMRMSTKDALFDEEFGSLKYVYSDRIRAIMRLFIEGIKRSYIAAGVAIIKIADHLKQLQDVEKNIKNSLGTLTSTLRTTATVFAPLIAGVTLGITKLIINVIEKMNLSSIHVSTSLFGLSKYAIINVDANQFVLVVGIYIMQLVFLLTRFANGIDEGDDKIEFIYSLGKSLPVAMFLFGVVTIFSMAVFGRMSPL